jgi:hypothetical protein
MQRSFSALHCTRPSSIFVAQSGFVGFLSFEQAKGARASAWSLCIL